MATYECKLLDELLVEVQKLVEMCPAIRTGNKSVIRKTRVALSGISKQIVEVRKELMTIATSVPKKTRVPQTVAAGVEKVVAGVDAPESKIVKPGRKKKQPVEVVQIAEQSK